MSESAPARVPSRTQQRMKLERARNYSILMIVVFGVNAIWWLSRGLFDGGEVIFWLLAGMSSVVVMMSVASLVRARRQLREFKEEHGPDVGQRS